MVAREVALVGATRPMRRRILAALVVISLAGCANDPRSAGTIIGDMFAGFAGPEYLYLRQQQWQQAAQREEARAASETWQKIWLQTDDPFEARRQTMVRHFPLSPELARRIDQLTEIGWIIKGGDGAAAVCYMRGFQFGTTHHDQCVYDVKMERGKAEAQEQPVKPTSRPGPAIKKASPPVAGGVEQGGKVYDGSECIGPVIMGRCEGTILPKKAYHPTCYGTWLNGKCTGPMF
jgi:hypothetical protein